MGLSERWNLNFGHVSEVARLSCSYFASKLEVTLTNEKMTEA